MVIVGAGFGGIAAAIELQRAGLTEITILEAGPGVGGTWLWNTYPGAACDIPSHAYSYSYAQRRDWTRLCSPQPEILAYMRSVADEFGVTDRVVTDSPVADATWDEDAQRWTTTTTDGRAFESDVLLVATGQLNHPRIPDVPGLDQFAGEHFHSARWNHSAQLAGKRIAVIGNAASAVQFVPEIVGDAAHTTVFQRTGNWFMWRRNRPYPAVYRAVIKHLPGFQRLRRSFVFAYTENITRTIRHPRTWGRVMAAESWLFMRWQLRGEPELRRKVWPTYTFGCKRVLFASKFLPALRRENVDLVTEPIKMITERGVVTADGREHSADVIIHATGFDTTSFMLPMEIRGRGGETLSERWEGGKSAHAHLGMTVPGFPSLFVLYGPNTNTSGGSIIFFLEKQVRYVRQALELMAARGGSSIEVRAEVEAASDRRVQAAFDGTAWLDCDSWYRVDNGRVVTNWPGYMRDFQKATETLDPSEYVVHHGARVVTES